MQKLFWQHLCQSISMCPRQSDVFRRHHLQSIRPVETRNPNGLLQDAMAFIGTECREGLRILTQFVQRAFTPFKDTVQVLVVPQRVAAERDSDGRDQAHELFRRDVRPAQQSLQRSVAMQPRRQRLDRLPVVHQSELFLDQLVDGKCSILVPLRRRRERRREIRHLLVRQPRNDLEDGRQLGLCDLFVDAFDFGEVNRIVCATSEQRQKRGTADQEVPKRMRRKCSETRFGRFDEHRRDAVRDSMWLRSVGMDPVRGRGHTTFEASSVLMAWGLQSYRSIHPSRRRHCRRLRSADTTVMNGGCDRPSGRTQISKPDTDSTVAAQIIACRRPKGSQSVRAPSSAAMAGSLGRSEATSK